MTTAPIYDITGKLIAPPQTVLPPRPAGNWDLNRATA
jgi:hypothetical protein